MSMIVYVVVKRVIDLLVSVFLWILLSPLVLVISICIKVADGGEIFVGSPKRLARGYREFFMYKFRTMIPGAHMIVDRKELFKNHKLENDVRVTKIGRILRSTDMDELPQLINVILGDMSLVGPRPYYVDEIEYHLERYPKDIEFFKNIMNTKPGLTGIWQVSGRNEIPFRERLMMESEYATHRSILKDMYILLKTPFVVITRKGVRGKNV
jgi:lipopolysaccharide/colanic/teichoic acid biosynthesis glycosyltransferase